MLQHYLEQNLVRAHEILNGLIILATDAAVIIGHQDECPHKKAIPTRNIQALATADCECNPDDIYWVVSRYCARVAHAILYDPDHVISLAEVFHDVLEINAQMERVTSDSSYFMFVVRALSLLKPLVNK